jgi:hypothetical protein
MNSPRWSRRPKSCSKRVSLPPSDHYTRSLHFASLDPQLTQSPGQVLNIPVFATTQNKARLGETCPELGLDAPGGVKTECHVDKTLFSMVYDPTTSYD